MAVVLIYLIAFIKFALRLLRVKKWQECVSQTKVDGKSFVQISRMNSHYGLERQLYQYNAHVSDWRWLLL